MQTEILRIKIELHKYLAGVVVVAAAPNFPFIFSSRRTALRKCEWRSRSNAVLPVELKSAGRLSLHEHISFSMHKI